jgi:GntR family transcriptional regulator
MAELVRAEGVPIYVQIREALREDITGGGLKRGEKLPAEHELADRFGVSRMTIRESIEDLVDEGLLYRRHGVGTFVAYPHLQRDHTRLTSFFDKAGDEGIKVRAKLLKLEVIPAKPKVAEALDVPEAPR